MSHFELQPGKLQLSDLRSWFYEHQTLKLSDEANDNIATSAKTVADVLDQGRVVYGINTGFGLLANTRIPPERLTDLQRRIVLSHAAGTGDLMEDAVVRLMLLLKVKMLFLANIFLLYLYMMNILQLSYIILLKDKK